MKIPALNSKRPGIAFHPDSIHRSNPSARFSHSVLFDTEFTRGITGAFHLRRMSSPSPGHRAGSALPDGGGECGWAQLDTAPGAPASGPAVVDGNIVTLTGTGLVVVRASQPGDATYAPAPSVDQVLIVTTRENAIGEVRRFPDGRFNFGFVGDFNRPYRVEYSTNLADWLPLATNSVNALGTLEITDGDGTGQPRRFYRVKGL